MRLLKYNAVGALGFLLQLGALAAMHTGFGMNYLAATCIAVEMAVLHNFFWHERWTWSDRSHNGNALGRLLRFNLTTGLVSIAINVILMRWLVGSLHAPYLAANVLCVGVGVAVNYSVSDRLVFVIRRRDPKTAVEAGAS